MKPRGELCQPPWPHAKGKGLLRYSGKLPHTPLCTNDKQLQDVPSPWMEETPCQATKPSWVLAPCMWLRLHQQVWSRAQEGRQSYGHPAQEASLISWVSRRAQDEASVCGTPGKAGQGGAAAPQFPTLGTRMQAAVSLCPTIAFVLLLRQERGNRPPPPQPHVTPPTAHPVPPSAGS